jgi:hypothetical protein
MIVALIMVMVNPLYWLLLYSVTTTVYGNKKAPWRGFVMVKVPKVPKDP